MTAERRCAGANGPSAARPGDADGTGWVDVTTAGSARSPGSYGSSRLTPRNASRKRDCCEAS